MCIKCIIGSLKQHSNKFKHKISLYNRAYMQLNSNELHIIQMKKIEKLYVFNLVITCNDKKEPQQYKWYKNVNIKCSICKEYYKSNKWINIKKDNTCNTCSARRLIRHVNNFMTAIINNNQELDIIYGEI